MGIVNTTPTLDKQEGFTFHDFGCNKVSVIKALRFSYGWGLKDAKEFSEFTNVDLPPNSTTNSRHLNSGGRKCILTKRAYGSA